MKVVDVKQFNSRFELTKEQIQKFYDWKDSLPEAYFGADSNGITFSFPQCSIGNVVIAKRREGEEIDLTDWENF